MLMMLGGKIRREAHQEINLSRRLRREPLSRSCYDGIAVVRVDECRIRGKAHSCIGTIIGKAKNLQL